MEPISYPLHPTVLQQRPVWARRPGRALTVLLVAVVGAVGVAGTLHNSRAGGVDAAHASAGALRSPAQFAVSQAPAAAAPFAKSALNLTAHAPTASGALGGSTALPAGATGQSARVEESGSLDLLVPGAEIGPDIGRLTALVAAYGGFVAATETQSASPGSPAEGTVTLQVPEPSFDALVSQAQHLGKVASLTTQATNVTGQYVDLQARITALQASRQQYLVIMTKATTVGSVLAVQSQLDNLQSDLEQLQGQLQLLDSETAYSTLAVTLSQKVVVPPPPKPRSGLSAAWGSAVNGFVGGFEDVLRIAGPLLFALVLLAGLWFSGRGLWRFKHRRSAQMPGEIV
jgi:hypothetical protein